MFHRHDWIILSEYKFKNELQDFSGVKMDSFTANKLAKRGLITVVKCNKCSKIKHIKTIL